MLSKLYFLTIVKRELPGDWEIRDKYLVMKEINTETIIDAPASEVWKVLMDFKSYSSWNPFIISIEGQQEVGKKLTNTLLSQGKKRVFKPVILTLEENHRFEWLGAIPLNLFTGRHYFILEKLSSGQTRFIHGEKFGGLLRGWIMKQIGEETYQNFVAMNRALKTEVESRR